MERQWKLILGFTEDRAKGKKWRALKGIKVRSMEVETVIFL